VNEYENVEVTFIPGKEAVLAVFEDGAHRERIVLSDYKTKPELHALMIEKGFVRKGAGASGEKVEAGGNVREHEETGEETGQETAGSNEETVKETAESNEETGKETAESNGETRKETAESNGETVKGVTAVKQTNQYIAGAKPDGERTTRNVRAKSEVDPVVAMRSAATRTYVAAGIATALVGSMLYRNKLWHFFRKRRAVPK